MKNSYRKVVFMGFSLPKEEMSDIYKTDINPAVQTNNFGWSLLKSISYSNKNEIILTSTHPVQDYPLNKRIIYRRKEFKEHGIHGVTIFFINILLIKHISRFVSIIKEIISIILVDREKIDIIITHGIHTPFLISAYLIKVMSKNLILVAVLTDPPGVILNSDSKIKKKLKIIDSFFIKKILKKFNGVIALSDNLALESNIDSYIVLPGIVNSDNLHEIECAKKNHYIKDSNKEKFIITYAGNISEAYGAQLLIELAKRLLHTDIHINIYGSGEDIDIIKSASEKYSNITFFGFIEPAELYRNIINSDILLNPRTVSHFISNNSFPSKLIEYVITGIPVVTTPITSIPQNIKSCFFIAKDDSANSIIDAINQVKDLNNQERTIFTNKAIEIVSKYYSESAVSEQIEDFFITING